MRHIVSHTGKPNTEYKLDSQGKHALNWMQQENSRTAFEIARDKVSGLELAFQTLESKAGMLTGFVAVILVAPLGFITTGHPWRRGRRLGLGQADMRVCGEVLGVRLWKTRSAVCCCQETEFCSCRVGNIVPRMLIPLWI